MNIAGDRFDELRQLCTAAGDKASLAIGMAGLVTDHGIRARVREASQLASEKPWRSSSRSAIRRLMVGLSFAPIYVKIESAEYD